MPKGPAIRQLRGDTGRPVAFVDDIPHNLVSVRAAVADAHLFHLMAMPSLRALLPPLPDDMIVVEDWSDAAPRIASALGHLSRRYSSSRISGPAGLSFGNASKACLLEYPRRADEEPDRPRIARLVNRTGFDDPGALCAGEVEPRLPPGGG